MKVYFSAIPETDRNDYEPFEDAEGVAYYYSVEYIPTSESFVFKDTSNRYIPVDKSSLVQCIDALESLLACMVSSEYSNPDSVVIED
mgnify:CR=1 FL=1